MQMQTPLAARRDCAHVQPPVEVGVESIVRYIVWLEDNIANPGSKTKLQGNIAQTDYVPQSAGVIVWYNLDPEHKSDS